MASEVGIWSRVVWLTRVAFMGITIGRGIRIMWESPRRPDHCQVSIGA